MLLPVCLLGLIGTGVKAVSGSFVARLESELGATVGHGLRLRIGRSALTAGLASSGAQAMASLSVRIREVEQAVVFGVLRFWRAAAQLVPLLAALIWLSASLAAVAVLVVMPFALGLRWARARWRGAHRHSQSLAERLLLHMNALLENVELWRSYGAGQRVYQAIERAGRSAILAQGRVEAHRAAISGFNEFAGAMALVAVVTGVAFFGGPFSSPDAVVFVAVILMAYAPLKDLGDARAWRLRGQVALEELRRLERDLVVEPPADDGSPVQARRGTPECLECVELGARAFGPVTSFRAEPGQLLALIGPTGSGKTTLLRVMLGLESPRGCLRYGATDLTAVAVGPDARPFAWVPQEAPLVDGSLLENVALVGGDEGRAEQALRDLGAHALYEELGDTPLGANGRQLSGGQRRWVALARALCSGAPVLLLDEPTAGLDAASTVRVVQALVRLKGRRTMLVATHDAELARVADACLPIGGRLPAG